MKKHTQRAAIRVIATWANDDAQSTIKVSPQRWRKIQQGAKYLAPAWSRYEGRRSPVTWSFFSGLVSIEGSDGSQHVVDLPVDQLIAQAEQARKSVAMIRPAVFFYRIADHNDGAVFARKERAELVHRINVAMENATTWAEFRALMPRKEYSSIVRFFDDCGDPRPKGGDAFSKGQVPGFDQGDYPPWLQSEMDRLFNASMLENFGARQDTFLNDPYWHITPEKAEEMAVYLRSCGAVVTERNDLQFH